MSIENNIERIANALEAIAGKGGAAVPAPAQPETPAEDTPAVRRTRPAKPVAEKPAPEKVAPPVEEEVDPFADEAPAAELTIDDVRKALLACQERIGPAGAQAVFKKVAGAESLSVLKQSGDKSKFAAIIKAANAA